MNVSKRQMVRVRQMARLRWGMTMTSHAQRAHIMFPAPSSEAYCGAQNLAEWQRESILAERVCKRCLRLTDDRT